VTTLASVSSIFFSSCSILETFILSIVVVCCCVLAAAVYCLSVVVVNENCYICMRGG